MLDGRMRHLEKKTIQLTSQIKGVLRSNLVVTTREAHWEDGTQISLHPQELAAIVPPVHVIVAERRFQVEERNRETFSGFYQPLAISRGALFLRLLDSPTFQQKLRFAAIKSASVQNRHFLLGELDVALDQH